MLYVDARKSFSIDDLPPYLTEGEVAQWLKTPVKTIIRMRYDRKGPPFKRLGTEYRYPMTGLLDWLNCKNA